MDQLLSTDAVTFAAEGSRRMDKTQTKQRKRIWPIVKFLMSLGVPGPSAWGLAKSGKGILNKNSVIMESVQLTVSTVKH